MLISIEGIPGSGKTSVSTELCRRLSAEQVRPVTHVSYPGFGVVGSLIRDKQDLGEDFCLVDMHLAAADMAEQAPLVSTVLSSGGIVVTDSITPVSMQVKHCKLGTPYVAPLYMESHGPNLVILLDRRPEDIVANSDMSEEEKAQKIEHLSVLRQRYFALACWFFAKRQRPTGMYAQSNDALDSSRWVVATVSATMSVEDVVNVLMSMLRPALGMTPPPNPEHVSPSGVGIA